MSNAILPMPPFEWQKEVWHEFYQSVRDDRLPHAFLLEGKQGVGVESLALAMGQYLLCSAPLNQLACGHCKSCLLLGSATHPDLAIIKPEDKSLQIKVDQIRKAMEFVAKTAQQGGMKVVIIEPGEAMNINAANALLKSLEEPAGDTVFVVVTYSGGSLLPTIRSRCAHYKLSDPSHAQAMAWLRDAGLKDAELSLFEATGAPLLAKAYWDDGSIKTRIEVIKDLEAIAARTMEPLAFAGKWAKEEPIALVSPMIRCLEVFLGHKLAAGDVPGHYAAIVRMLERRDPSVLFRLLDQLKARKLQMLSSPNLNATLLIEELALDWTTVITKS